MKIDSMNFEDNINFQEIEESINNCCRQINTKFYLGLTDVVFICVLKGAVPFFTYLTQKLYYDGLTQTDYISASSYGDELESSGFVKIDLPPTIDFKGKRVVIVDDIIDTGLTMSRLINYFKVNGANEVFSCALFYKKGNTVFVPDFYGMEIGKEFIVGFGLDFLQRYRNMNFIVRLEGKNENH